MRTRYGMTGLIFLWVISFFWFGVVFYNYLDAVLGWYWLDELLVLSLVAVYSFSLLKTFRVDRRLLMLIGVFGAYLIYSASIKINSIEAILSDFAVVIKAPLACLIMLALRPEFTRLQWRILRVNALAGAVFVFVVILAGEYVTDAVFGHPSRLATAAILTALLYLLASISLSGDRLNGVDVLIFCVIILLSLPSLRAKAYGYVAATLIITMYFYIHRQRRAVLSLLRVSPFAVAAGTLTLYVAFDKIVFYFVTGTQGDEMFARPALYLTSLLIAKDMFPLGSGFGSFASYYSAVYYSPLYFEYGLHLAHGLSEDNPSFVSDTFIPMMLAQFGVFGLVMMFVALVTSIRAVYVLCSKDAALNKYMMLSVLIYAFIVIESVADSTLVQNRGVFVLTLAALAHVSSRHRLKYLNRNAEREVASRG